MTTIGVLFGGRSGEHEISLVSGRAVMAGFDKSRYRVLALGIRKDGAFASAGEARAMLGHPVPPGVEPAGVDLRPAASGRLIDLRAVPETGGLTDLDIICPILHGPFGEDGTIQGLLELTGLPYVGCGVLESALGMDKAVLKLVFQAAGLPVAPWLTLTASQWQADPAGWTRRVAGELGYPCFVKPARLGSSVGISRVPTESGLAEAVATALRWDYKILIERGVNAREIECSVLGLHDPQASPPGEVVPQNEFYDYAAKYIRTDSELHAPADLAPAQAELARDLARRAFTALGGEGLGRVDFLLDRLDGTMYINEINTIPGFTPISMFPRLWALDGLELPALLDRLVELARKRASWKAGLTTSYDTAAEAAGGRS